MYYFYLHTWKDLFLNGFFYYAHLFYMHLKYDEHLAK